MQNLLVNRSCSIMRYYPNISGEGHPKLKQNIKMNDIALEVTGATKIFGGVTVLDHVDFTLRKGEVHILMGENGAGKSTLIKIIAGAYIPNAGSIKLNGEPILTNSPIEALEKGISVVYQELNLV